MGDHAQPQRKRHTPPPSICLRCGLCCYIEKRRLDFTLWLPCRYLRGLPTGKTYCTIYSRRLGREIAPGVKCTLRKDYPYNIKGCSFNTPDKKPHPVFS